MGIYGFTIQLYCDFSGYSDMAIGIALLLGYKLKMNFDAPFKSQSPTEYWRRWHISLSSWLRDYLYIPMGRQPVLQGACSHECVQHYADRRLVAWRIVDVRYMGCMERRIARGA